MSEIDEFERRISAALDRLARGVESLGAEGAGGAPEGGADAEEVTRLRAELEEERLANAQLEERVRAIREKQDGHVRDLEERLETQSTAFARLDGELQRLKKVNEQLRDSNAALREIATDGVAEPHLINKAMLSELEALRVARGAEAAEAAAILAALDPLIAPDPAAEKEQQDA
jgi:predicted RNase H-like nuclease (RuvC/YqgF family)